jgi:hypothetical protein
MRMSPSLPRGVSMRSAVERMANIVRLPSKIPDSLRGKKERMQQREKDTQRNEGHRERETERQRETERETEKQRNRETERERDSVIV